jgi:hypothetical protein
MAPLVCAKALVECQANLVSYFDLALSWFLGNEAFIDALEYIGFASLKTSHPYELPLWGKEYGP